MIIEDKALLYSIMENSQDIISVKDLNLNYVVCSRAFLKLLNISHESVVLGKNIRDIVLPETYETITKNINLVLETREPISYTFNISNAEGVNVLSQLSTPVVEDGEITGILSVARNITNEENLKLKLVEKICDLNSLLEEKRNLELQKELFISTLTHDLKNPVQAQIMSLKLLKDGMFGKLSGEQTDILSTLLESSQYMQNMLYSILETYKYDNGLINLKKDIVDMDNLIKLCINEVFSAAKYRGIKINYNSQVKNSSLCVDSEQLRRVIGNLLNNAINYSYKDSEINILLSYKDGYLLFNISNFGHPLSDKNKIFEKYYTGNDKKGIGLGLYFSKKVIEAHGGKIYAKSENEHTTFGFELPIQKAMSDNVISLN